MSSLSKSFSAHFSDAIVTGLVLLLIVSPVLVAIAYASAPTSYLNDAPLLNTFWAILAGLSALGGLSLSLYGLHHLLEALEKHLSKPAPTP
ncbi:hypothetical protein [Actinotalea sp. C106]|uniref:hypothetical protein n=1 Tax=Actinotalea sp. C106 TaxID=2908644 RepID=UPI002027D0C7|nr:hypothetical protein [Actinotalea sp. C106]